jgi:hypothetical protein
MSQLPCLNSVQNFRKGQSPMKQVYCYPKEVHSDGDPKYTEWRGKFAAAASEDEVAALLKTTMPWESPDDQEAAEQFATEARNRLRGVKTERQGKLV